MIHYRTGDATQPIGEGPKVIVHVCNDVGAWGAGFVLALSRKWPEPEERYRAWANREEEIPFKLGEVQFVEVEPQLWVANMIGQHGTYPEKGVPPVRYEAIREGLRKVADFAREHGTSIHAPPFGAGLAGGKWEEIEPIIEEELEGLSVTIYDLPK